MGRNLGIEVIRLAALAAVMLVRPVREVTFQHLDSCLLKMPQKAGAIGSREKSRLLEDVTLRRSRATSSFRTAIAADSARCCPFPGNAVAGAAVA